MSEKLEKARLYEIEEAKNIPQEEKPAFHVSAPVGWINDPNGFSVFKGKVHLFYQYHPYSRDWGPMHWGHSVTEDMIRWEQLPAERRWHHGWKQELRKSKSGSIGCVQ